MSKPATPLMHVTFEVFPPNGNFPDGESWISGRLENSNGHQPTDLRARVGGAIFLGLLDQMEKTTPGSASFALLICPPPGSHMLQIEVWLPSLGWTEIFRQLVHGTKGSISQRPSATWLDRLPRFARNLSDRQTSLFSADAIRAVEGAIATPLNVFPSPPFFGRLETPCDDGYVRQGKLLISGWLLHLHRPILRLTARVNGRQSDTALVYGLQRRDVHSGFPDHFASGHSHFLGLIDFNFATPDPGIILVFADVGDETSSLVFAHRFIPWDRTANSPPEGQLSRIEELRLAASLLLAGWRCSGKIKPFGFRPLLNVPGATAAARLAAAVAPFAESTPLSLLVSSLEDHELQKPKSTGRGSTISTAGLNLLFIIPCDFSYASALHVLALANELSLLGHTCIAAAPERLDTLDEHEFTACTGILHADVSRPVLFPNGRGPDIVHAWTARERVRRVAAQAMRNHPQAALMIHLEDNEQSLLRAAVEGPMEDLLALTETDFDRLANADVWHPREGPQFLRQAKGVTLIIATLQALVPAHIPTCVVTPSADRRYFHPQQTFAQARHLIADKNVTILFYNGNVHASNAAEVRELYAAVLALNRNGIPTRLIRTGINEVDFLGTMAPAVEPFVHNVGKIKHRNLPPLMALADMFVQPGTNNDFNAFRFPSKLPEFFSFGRPVIMPRTNLGLIVRHGTDAYVLENADGTHIADAVRLLRSDTELYRRLAAGAMEFSERYFSWSKSARILADFYETIVSSTAATHR